MGLGLRVKGLGFRVCSADHEAFVSGGTRPGSEALGGSGDGGNFETPISLIKEYLGTQGSFKGSIRIFSV